MWNLVNLYQLFLGGSVLYVWIFRYRIVVKEFNQFGLSDLTRNFVGTSKIALATLIITGIWYPIPVQIPSILLGLFMMSAQYFHFKIKNPWIKHLPSMILLILCALISKSATT